MVQRLSGREKLFIVIIVVLALVYIFLYVLFKPWKEKNNLLDQKINAAQVKLERELRTIQKAKKMETAHAAYLNEFHQTKSNEQVMSSIISEIDEVAAGFNLKISELKPKAVQKEDYDNRFSVSLTINSSLADIVQFLYVLQKEPHLFDVQQFRFDKDPSAAASAVKTYLVLGKIFIP